MKCDEYNEEGSKTRNEALKRVNDDMMKKALLNKPIPAPYTLEEILNKDENTVQFIRTILRWRGHHNHHSVKEFADYLWEKYQFEMEEYC